MQEIKVETHPGFNLHSIDPETPSLEPTVIIFPGLGNKPNSYHLQMRVGASLGRRMVCPDYIYGWDGEARRLRGLAPNVNQNKQDCIEAIVLKEGQSDFITHSQGSGNLASVALEHPEYFRKGILDAAGGIFPTRQLKIQNLLKLRAGDMGDGRDKKRLISKGGESGIWLAENSGSAEFRKKRSYLIDELIWGSSVSRVRDYQRLKQSGLKFIMVAHENDSMFPLQNYQRVLPEDLREDLITLPGNHGSIKFDRKICESLIKLLNNI